MTEAEQPHKEEGGHSRGPVEVGQLLEVEVGAVAHGGHCVARHDGQVVFVRHTLPGERVLVEVTSRTTRFLRGDAVEVLRAAPGRVPPRCPQARPGGCGGCDWQHADLATQRTLKAQVLSEQLRHVGVEVAADADVTVEEIAGAVDGLGWRTRERFSVDRNTGRPGLHRSRSHDVVALDSCPIASADLLATGVLQRTWPGVESIQVAVSSATDDVAVLVDGSPTGARRVREVAAGREWRVAADGFWQVHPGAADALVAGVREMLEPQPGEHLIDLYSGVGLYAGAFAEELGVTGRVDAVESSGAAVRDARRNLHDLPSVRLHEADVERWLARGGVRRCDLVVLDPPRAGAGRSVVERIVRLQPRAVVYVACDPAALSRDVKTFLALGWELARVRGLDLFPMTHHVEALALFTHPG